MADDALTTLQISKDYRSKLRQLAEADKRSMASEFEWMIDQELSRRFPAPAPAAIQPASTQQAATS